MNLIFKISKIFTLLIYLVVFCISGFLMLWAINDTPLGEMMFITSTVLLLLNIILIVLSNKLNYMYSLFSVIISIVYIISMSLILRFNTPPSTGTVMYIITVYILTLFSSTVLFVMNVFIKKYYKK